MIRFSAAAFAATFLALTPAVAQSQSFLFVADNPSGAGTHSGTVAVTPTATKDIYDVVWTITDGSVKGIARIDEGTDTVTAAYVQDGVAGLVILQEQPDRSWTGYWYQGGKTGAEVWAPAP
jgi:hypothetical protein